MSLSLVGSTALVTGASSGIGRAVAHELAQRGSKVLFVARRRDRLDDLAAALTAAGHVAQALAVDITDRQGARAAVDDVMARWGRLDIVVNSAGVMLNGPSLDSPLEEWEAMVDLNLKGLMYITKAALPHLLAAAADSPRRVADLVNVSSIAGRYANRGVAIYNATKFGVTAFSESLRQEFTKQGLRVSVVEPGAVDTELFGHQQPRTQRHYENLFAGVEKMHPEDLADLVAYIVTVPRRVAINEVVIRPTDQV